MSILEVIPLLSGLHLCYSRDGRIGAVLRRLRDDGPRRDFSRGFKRDLGDGPLPTSNPPLRDGDGLAPQMIGSTNYYPSRVDMRVHLRSDSVHRVNLRSSGNVG